ncbi:MAG: hypothetical protein JWR15_2705 [Prosthecobacter sp.]|nr:hypothetical protein [Prosthecobacter sp.]
MNALRLFCIGVTTLVLAVSSSLRAADGDAEWKKVNDVMESIKNPKENPQTNDAARAVLKQGLTEFDAAYAAAMKAAPTSPARWDVALFAVMLGRVRELAGVPAPEKEAISLDDIVKAADAKPETRSQASLTQVMIASDTALAPGGDPAAWIARAEKHLKDFPEEKLNKIVEVKLQEINLRTQPLDLKFTALDGRAVDVSKLQGKVVLIDFWATWSAPCMGEVPNVVNAYKAYHAKGFEIIGISLDTNKSALQSVMAANGMVWPEHYDGKGWQNAFAVKFGINAIPAMWLIDQQGRVITKNARTDLAGQVAKLLTP